MNSGSALSKKTLSKKPLNKIIVFIFILVSFGGYAITGVDKVKCAQLFEANLNFKLEKLNRELKTAPNPTAYYRRSRLYLEQMRLIQSFEDLKTAIELNPGKADVYLSSLANFALDTYKLGPLKRSLKLVASEHPYAYYILGLIYLREGHYHDAIKTFNKVSPTSVLSEAEVHRQLLIAQMELEI